MSRELEVRTVTVELTQRCHRRCLFCYSSHETKESPCAELPPFELAARARELVRETGCRLIQLSGGEPLLTDDLLGFIDALGREARISIITDGAHLDQALAYELQRRGVGPLQVTLLSVRPEVHDELRGEGSFRQITRAIAIARRAQLKVIVSMVITKKNWIDAASVAELSFALGARGLTLARCCSAGAALENSKELLPEPEHVVAAANAAAPMCRSLGLQLSAAITIPRCIWPDPESPPLKVGVCSLVGPRTTVTVGPDGSIRSCGLSSTTAGILGEAPWSEISEAFWKKELEPLRNSIPPHCRKCSLFERCLGGCRLSAQTTGTGLDPLVRVKTKDY